MKSPVAYASFMDQWTYLAFLAGALTSTGYIPQIVKGYRTRKMEDVSLIMPVVLGSGMFLWLIYGIVREDAAIIAANLVGTVLTATLVAMKMKHQALV